MRQRRRATWNSQARSAAGSDSSADRCHAVSSTSCTTSSASARSSSMRTANPSSSREYRRTRCSKALASPAATRCASTASVSSTTLPEYEEPHPVAVRPSSSSQLFKPGAGRGAHPGDLDRCIGRGPALLVAEAVLHVLGLALGPVLDVLAGLLGLAFELVPLAGVLHLVLVSSLASGFLGLAHPLLGLLLGLVEHAHRSLRSSGALPVAYPLPGAGTPAAARSLPVLGEEVLEH